MILVTLKTTKYQLIILERHIVKTRHTICKFIMIKTRIGNWLDINLKLSINFILHLIDLPLPLPLAFLIGTERFIYFSLFSPKHLQIFLLAL